MKTTNVQNADLNYDRYGMDEYDSDIRKVIPGHEDLHKQIENSVTTYAQGHQVTKIADLGIGTGLTSERILSLVPEAQLTAVDFSDNMIQGAKKRLAAYDTNFITGDYSEIDFGNGFDIVTGVIGIHHQTTEGKQKLFQKIFNSLKHDGMFIFGDLVTYADKMNAAFNDAKHYAFMVEHAEDDTSLKEWAYHHKFLNNLEPIEDQVAWLQDAGFRDVQTKYQFLNTALIIAIK